VAGALTYTAYRASGADQNFTAIGTVAGPSFSDAGLSPATSYAYKLTANAGGSEGPASTVVTATTLPVPPARHPAAALSRAKHAGDVNPRVLAL
jgi:chitodextrinase